MARPIKNFCDYFTHDRDMRNHRKIKAIRNKLNIQGYAIWNMILEYLTGSDGNVFEYSDMELELMSGDFGVSVTEIREVVDYCILLELLFLKDGFISSESLDERLNHVYEKRKVAKSKSKKQIRVNGKFSYNNAETIGVSVTEMPQSKVKESKVNKTEEMIVSEMMKIWKEKNPDYVFSKTTDFTACLKIAYQIGEFEGIDKSEVVNIFDTVNFKEVIILNKWKKIVDFIIKDKFYFDFSIEGISVEKNLQKIYNSIKKSSKPPNGSNKNEKGFIEVPKGIDYDNLKMRQ